MFALWRRILIVEGTRAMPTSLCVVVPRGPVIFAPFLLSSATKQKFERGFRPRLATLHLAVPIVAATGTGYHDKHHADSHPNALQYARI
jgi:hypothetical protein